MTTTIQSGFLKSSSLILSFQPELFNFILCHSNTVDPDLGGIQKKRNYNSKSHFLVVKTVDLNQVFIGCLFYPLAAIAFSYSNHSCLCQIISKRFHHFTISSKYLRNCFCDSSRFFVTNNAFLFPLKFLWKELIMF